MTSAPSRRSLVAGGTAAALASPLFARTAAAAPPGPAGPGGSGHGVTPGADAAAAQGWRMLRGREVGVVSNPTGVLRDASHVVDSMAAHEELRIAGVFGPEHGFRGSAQAGESEPEFKDPRTGLTVYDAYGADAAKMAGLFRKSGADTIVFDIQDVGVRFYTYIWTMYHAMVAARTIGASFVVLDRPNPIGRRADGPLLTPEFASGVGLKPIIQQHGMTVGELARYFNGELLPREGDGGKVKLEVVRVRGWEPRSTAQDTGLPWVPPSPNMPTADTASAYAGTGYFEGTNLSEGRGTTQPFQFVGAPYLDYHFSDRLNALRLPGVRFREGYFVPTFSKHEGKTCAGVQLLVTDPGRYEAVPTAVAMLVEARKYDAFEWRKDADPKRPFWIDKLSGSPRLREMVDAGKDVREITAAWRSEVRDFERARRPYLLYR
ncbi:exo-beta-N-acetylmuramidase NamZ family protein [Streptomyces iconiensis]|uniref:DUF1343 domain-containing protein n=1 Tax=Streptomyces iconiensis TaxID=1384038 RepID=A0ABT6ZV36_9ACTN|nr:DUF1343 domain-containing protein [Streptomyces iconiensis]MDJ1132910.1 DUF1343 domain-containing protein [Streptomyces iconiensis]